MRVALVGALAGALVAAVVIVWRARQRAEVWHVAGEGP